MNITTIAQAVAWATAEGIVDRYCRLRVEAECIIYAHLGWSDEEESLFDALCSDVFHEPAMPLRLVDRDYNAFCAEFDELKNRATATPTSQPLRIAEACAWGIERGVLDEGHSIRLTGDELIQRWALWSDQERNWFEYLAEDNNFHSLTKYLHNGDHKAVRSYLSPNAAHLAEV